MGSCCCRQLARLHQQHEQEQQRPQEVAADLILLLSPVGAALPLAAYLAVAAPIDSQDEVEGQTQPVSSAAAAAPAVSRLQHSPLLPPRYWSLHSCLLAWQPLQQHCFCCHFPVHPLLLLLLLLPLLLLLLLPLQLQL